MIVWALPQRPQALHMNNIFVLSVVNKQITKEEKIC